MESNHWELEKHSIPISRPENVNVATALSMDLQAEKTCIPFHQGSDFRAEDNASNLGKKGNLRDANTLVKMTPLVRIKLEGDATALNRTPRASDRRSQFKDTTGNAIKESRLSGVVSNTWQEYRTKHKVRLKNVEFRKAGYINKHKVKFKKVKVQKRRL